MLLSLLKILVFLALVAALAMGITYLLDAENIVLGDVQTTIAGTEYTISPLQTVIFIFILILFFISHKQSKEGMTIIVVKTKNVPQSPFSQSTNAPEDDAKVVLPAVPIEASNAY